MRTLLKIILLLVVIALAGLIALPFVVDPNDYKQEIAEQVEKATGRKLTLEGDIGLSVFPWVALELGPLSLSNAAGFDAASFAQVNAAKIRIKLIPLLKNQLQMDTIVLDGLVLNLQQDKLGNTNWDDLAGADSTTTSSDKPAAQTGDRSSTLAAIDIAGIELTNASIAWSDARNAQQLQLQNLNLSTEPLHPGSPSAVVMDFTLLQSQPEARLAVKLTANVTANLQDQQYALDQLKLSMQATGAELPLTTSEINLSADLHADMIKQLVSVQDLLITANGNKNKRLIDARLSTQVLADLAKQQTSLQKFELTAEITDPELADEKIALSLSTDISSDMQQQTLQFSSLAVEVHDLLMQGELALSKLLSDEPNFAGQLSVPPFNLRQLANRLAIELPPMQDPDTLSKLGIQTEFSGSDNHFKAQQLSLTLDQTHLSGSLRVNDFTNPAINFALKVDQIDADRYLAPTDDNQLAATPAPDAPMPATAASGSSEQIPLEPLRQLHAKGSVDIGKLKISGIHSENIHLTLNAAKGLIRLQPLKARLYQGSYQGNIILDARGNALKLSVNEKLSNVQVAPLLQDLSGDAPISGTVNASARLAGNGLNVQQIKQTLAGRGQFAFTDGAVQGINIAESIRIAQAALKGETLPASNAPLQTDFSSLTGSFKADKGIIHNQDLLLKSPLLRIKGAGEINLPIEEIDYGLRVSIVDSAIGQGGKSLAELRGFTIPVNITGTFDSPVPSVDLATLAKEQASQELKNQVADKLKDELGDELGSFIGGALGVQPNNGSSASDSNNNDRIRQQPKKDNASENPLEDVLNNTLKGLF